MDRTDVSLCLALMTDSRTPYHELASKLGLSINAVHKRIAAMMKMGIIRTFTAHPSLVSLGAVSVWVYGRSEAEHPGDLHKILCNNDHTYWVANSGGGFTYVGGYLRDISELDEYVAFVKRIGEISDPTVGIIPSFGQRPRESLHPLDFQILASLMKDSRKPVTDVAADVKASAKTVHRRLEWMVEKRLAEFTIEWYPDASNDIISLCHVEAAKRFDRQKVLETLREKFSKNILVEILFSNMPNVVVIFTWANSMKQMEDLREKMGELEEVKSVMLNVLQIGYIFDTWRDKLVQKNALSVARTKG
jgi:DNA-binding Lrp family transcriptional regulator